MHGEGTHGRCGSRDGSNASSSLSLLILHHVSSGVGVLAVGGVVAKVRTGQDTAKKGPLTLRGKATEGDTSGGMASGTGETRDDATGRGCGSDAGSSSSPSNLHRVSLGLGVLAEVRTGQDTTKKKGPLT